MSIATAPLNALELRKCFERLGRALDVGVGQAAAPIRWSEVETDDRLDTDDETTYAISKLAQKGAVEALLGFTQLFGGVLTAATSAEEPSYLQGLNEPLPLDSRLTAKRIRRFVRENRKEGGKEFSTLRLDLVLRLDKQSLLSRISDLPQDVCGNLFIFPERLESFLQQSFPELEKWWRDSTADSGDRYLARALVLVGIRDLHIQGPHLLVLESWPKADIELPRRPQEKSPRNGEEETQETHPAEPEPAALIEDCRRQLNWDTDWLHHLTPIHLDVEAKSADEGSPTVNILNALQVHQVNLCILFTADRTRTANGSWLATYAGGQRQVDVRLQTPQHALPAEGAQAAKALTQLVRWAYIRKFQTDRLSFVQSSIAQALPTGTDDELADRRYDLLVRWSSTGWAEIQSRWKLFIESKIDEFTAQVQALEDHVASTVRAFAAESTAMIKSLTEAMLAAVAAVLGSFLAALLKEPFDPGILALGVFLYTLYLLAFPLGFGMSQRWSTYRSLKEQFENRCRHFELRLYPEKVEKIVGTQFQDAKSRFERWFVATLVAYLGVTTLLVVTLIAATLWKLFG